MTGRLFACEVARSKMRVSVIGPVSDDVRGALGSDPETTRSSRRFLEGCYSRSPSSTPRRLKNFLSDGLNSFVDMAMARVRRPVSLEDHVPEAVAYIASVVGRELPQPDPSPRRRTPNSSMMTSDEDDAALRGSHGFAGGRRSSSTVSARLLR